ncbi:MULTISPECIES: hypothetical protein [unclassified Ruegeria]|uniref:hypothetical protein n=1 Tax=unclassified Ruegeria TaxID=2625375 RepID=UPI001490F7E3|nr:MULTISPECIES: hypothetical protein [unclassified Ruegeria]NOD48722.1 hypothetical protein [Ruegeria sp. HKCCD5849]NOD51976.1 hypothetical protein [Ruegeria sp. HKCCD5851]NOD66634.1 hypothetical protein [Ruegeria sp. HKCCD7303]
MIFEQPRTIDADLPPANALRVYRWADLPNLTAPALYRVTDPGQEPREVYASKHKRQVLEGLMRSPLYAASYCRLSDQVLPLRRDDGVNIECKMYRGDADTGRQKYGIYVLVSQVELIEERGVAA